MKNLVGLILKEIDNQKINLLISGGKSPDNFLREISKEKLIISKLNFFLIDERIVNNNSKYSNLHNLKKKLKYKILSNKIFDPKLSYFNKQKKSKFFKTLKKNKVISIVGIGNDGHYASIFPNSKNLNTLVDNEAPPNLYKVEKIGKPMVERATVNLSTILLSKKILLLISSKKKMKILSKSFKDKNHPLHHLLKCAKKKLLVFDAQSFERIKFKIR